MNEAQRIVQLILGQALHSDEQAAALYADWPLAA
jgi:hypothetical protein